MTDQTIEPATRVVQVTAARDAAHAAAKTVMHYASDYGDIDECKAACAGLTCAIDTLAVVASCTLPAEGPAAQPDQAKWRCFHCDESFTDREAAREHFGPTEQATPFCQIDVKHVRWLEEQHRRNCDDDTEVLRSMRHWAGEHETLRRQAEELGYSRGLSDARKHPEELGLTAKDELPAALHNPDSIKLAAELLVAAVQAAGFVLTVEQRSVPPLAMGNYVTEVSVRRARGAA